MRKFLLLIVSTTLVFMYLAVGYAGRVISSRIPVLKDAKRAISGEIRTADQKLRLIDKFEKEAPDFVKEVKVLKCVGSKKEAMEIYKRFRERFEINAEIGKASIKRGVLAFKVFFEENPDLIYDIYRFDPHIYFTLNELELAKEKCLVRLTGEVVFSF